MSLSAAVPSVFRMDIDTTVAATPSRVGSYNRWLYWVPTAALCAVFVASGIWYLVDPRGAADNYVALGFPGRYTIVYTVAALKILGSAVIVWGRWRTLTMFAFAGMLFNLLLALDAEIALRTSNIAVAAVTLVFWCLAFWADRLRFPRS
jgi:hypothetical protein